MSNLNTADASFDPLFRKLIVSLKDEYPLLNKRTFIDHVKKNVSKVFVNKEGTRKKEDSLRKLLQDEIALIKQEEHHKIEYVSNDSTDSLGNEGNFIYIPDSFVANYQNLERAFQDLTGLSQQHIIYTYEGDVVSWNGQPYEEK